MSQINACLTETILFRCIGLIVRKIIKNQHLLERSSDFFRKCMRKINFILILIWYVIFKIPACHVRVDLLNLDVPHLF